MAKVTFSSQEEYDAAIASAVEAALVPIREQHAAELAALNATIAKLQTNEVDYSAFEKFPDLLAVMKKTDLRVGALPALSVLEVWGGKNKASDIAKAIGTTPKLGDEKGGKVATAKMITAALQKAESAFMAANLGLGIRVTSISKSEGDSTVKKIRFAPIVDEDFDTPTGDNAVGEGTGATKTEPAGMVSV